jgi:hypothetical protein
MGSLLSNDKGPSRAVLKPYFRVYGSARKSTDGLEH